jgi:hypothetical protein
MKTTLVNLRLEDEMVRVLDALAGKALNRQAVARMLLIAAIEAVQRNQGRLHFPPQFKILESDSRGTYSFNEPQPTKRK